MGTVGATFTMGATHTLPHLSINVCQVGPGGCPPRPPADPDVRDYRIRLLGMWLRYARQTE